MKKENEKLEKWRKRLSEGEVAFAPEVEKMDHREAVYAGDNTLTPLVPGDTGENGELLKTCHVRNITFEHIESQISSIIPQPKVTPRRKKDEVLANVIEHFLRNELDRLPIESINDMADRTSLIQGGVGYLGDWDSRKRFFDHAGEFVLSMLHPKQLVPQPGVYTDVEDMDWFIVKIPTTKSAVKARYGKDVTEESESDPEIRSTGGEDYSNDAVTQYVGFQRNPNGGIDRYSWVNSVELEDLEDYQARRQPVCTRCGKVRPPRGQKCQPQEQPVPAPMELLQDAVDAPLMLPHEVPEPAPVDEDACPFCGGTAFISKPQELEQVFAPIRTAMGREIPGGDFQIDADGEPAWTPTEVPFYKPNVYPIVLQRSVSVYGQLLGNSDVDVIADQQNAINRLNQKIMDRLMKAGSRVTLPPKADIRIDPKDHETIYLSKPEQKAMIGVHTFTGDLQYELVYRAQLYEESRQLIGITDSMQGRRDPTATSAVAKEFSAAQAAGRMESKRAMKKAAYAKLFELMFKYQLAYADEPIPISYKDPHGNTVYEEFNRYDFLEQDANGQWHWNDQFLFSCDNTAPLASNREAMWQETRMNFQTGAFGDPAAIESRILFWTKMEELHYPGAAATKKHLEQQAQAQQEKMALMQALAQQQQPQPDGAPQQPMGQPMAENSIVGAMP